MQVTQQRLEADGRWGAFGVTPQTSAQLVLLFGARHALTNEPALRALGEMYPDAAIVGCTTAGEICGTRVSDDTAVATAIRFERSTSRVIAREVAAPELSREVGQALAAELPVEGLAHALVFAEGLAINGSALAHGLRAGLPHGVAVTGGLAADGARFATTLVCVNGQARAGVVAVIGLYGNRLRIGYGSAGGWEQFGPERLVTRSDHSILYELDGRSALSLYKQYLGAHASELPASGLKFPLSLRGAAGEPRLVRTILGIDEDTGSLRFAGDIPEGTYVQLMKANTARLVNGAQGAASASAVPHGAVPAELALLISCVGRRLVLGQRVEEEVEAVAQVLGKSPALCGFYSYGEIAPFAPSGKCELHNQTMTITTFAER